MLLDQRGCGRSRPNAETRGNTTWHLVSDLEALRAHLGVARWHLVFGGSWGSTLALAYAQAHPAAAGALVLRGAFAARRSELDWSLLRGGASALFPDAFDELLAFLAPEERVGGRHVAAFHRRLMSDDEAVSLPAARAWNRWEISISTLYPNVAGLEQLDDPSYLLAHARIEAHYFTNDAWLRQGQLLEKESIDKIRHIPSKLTRPEGVTPPPPKKTPAMSCGGTLLTGCEKATIVQGRYDVVCPPMTAWELHKAFPESKLHWVHDAGHSATVSPGEPFWCAGNTPANPAGLAGTWYEAEADRGL